MTIIIYAFCVRHVSFSFFVIRLELASSPDSMVFILGVMISHNSVLPSMLSIAVQLEVNPGKLELPFSTDV